MDDISTWEWVLLVWFLEIGSHRAQTGLEHAGVTQADLELLIFGPGDGVTGCGITTTGNPAGFHVELKQPPEKSKEQC